MPELPEVETIRRGLETKLVERSITEIDVRTTKLFTGDSTAVVGRPITALQRSGKLLIFRFDGPSVLTVHLKMTGQLIWTPAPQSDEAPLEIDNAELPFDAPEQEEDEGEIVIGGHPEKAYLEPLPHKHTHIIVRFDDGSTLYFNDLRKFGLMRVMAATDLDRDAFVMGLGPEPLTDAFTVEYLEQRLALRPRQPVKSFLLDQTNIAGLGNIYADESLFRAAILPDRQTGSLQTGEVRNLKEAIQETLEIALMHGGSSSKDYVDAVGDKGTFLKVANVYHRQGQPCNRCHEAVIERKKIGGRSSHYCPVCQY